MAPLEQVLIYHLSRRKSENLLSLTLAAVLLKDLRYGNNDGTLLRRLLGFMNSKIKLKKLSLLMYLVMILSNE
jgi:hypothetical protein